MPLPGLTLIGESINDSVPSTKKLFDANDIEGILALARSQDEKGADYIDVNVGRRSPDFMADMVKRVQAVTAKPLSIDTPDPEIAAAALKAYEAGRAGGKIPVLNSISPLRMQMLDLFEIQPFMPILMASERKEGAESMPCRTAEETLLAAKQMLQAVRQLDYSIANSQLILDPGICPIGGDAEGITRRVLDGMKLIHGDPELQGVHISVGLSNFTVMLPPKTADGRPVKGALESAFLTLAMPRGLDMIIGSVVRKYERLADDHPALVCLREVLQLEGVDAIMRVREFYSA
ncbi:MAG: dihydropteroate synthase [Verrucomicrobia bacterium]|nr:dihydropteroate synthase [Verrucomicrobiota bacterium]